MADTTDRDLVLGGWASAAAPPPDFTVSEWADEKRRLPLTSAAQGGRWVTAATPYLRGIMDSVHEPGVKLIALKKCHQSGGSEALHNILGYHIEHDPCAMLMVHPTEMVAEAWSKERLTDMINATPELRAVVTTKRQSKDSGDPTSTLLLKMFRGGFLALGGANSPNTFARWSARRAYGDDVDRWPQIVGEEGDPSDLLRNRTTSFHDGLAMFVSTPTLKGGRIDILYERSDRRRYVVPCPECGHEDWVTWSGPCGVATCRRIHFRVTYDDRDPETASIECPACHARMSEPDRRLMVAGGRWLATAEPNEPGHIGFHLPALISTLGDVTLSGLVAKWLAARAKGTQNLRVFMNTDLAEAWEDRGARMEPHALMTRREPYGPHGVEVPAAAVALTAGVDVQDDRFELQVQAWGPAYERWLVDWRTIPGDPKKAETQEALEQALQRRYHHALGIDLPIHAVCIDTGFATGEMYRFVLRHQARRIFATKGFAGRTGEPIVGKPSEKTSGENPRPVRLYPINVDDAKTDVMNSLALVAAGPGATHFPIHLETCDEEYFAQLCAEEKKTVYNKAKIATHTVWVKLRERNEALDTAVLCLAAFKLLNPNLRQYAEALAVAARELEPKATPPTTLSPTPPAVTAQPAAAAPTAPSSGTPARRVSRSTYLQR